MSGIGGMTGGDVGARPCIVGWRGSAGGGGGGTETGALTGLVDDSGDGDALAAAASISAVVNAAVGVGMGPNARAAGPLPDGGDGACGGAGGTFL